MLTLLRHQRERNTERGREKKPPHKCRVCNLKQTSATPIGSLVEQVSGSSPLVGSPIGIGKRNT
jgi:hypothetical protein